MAGPIEGDNGSGDRPGPRVSHVIAVVFFLALALFWIWAFSGLPDDTHPDRIADRDYAAVAQRRCTAAALDLERIEPAGEADDLVARAAQIDQASDRLEVMLDELEALTPPPGDDGRIVEEWLADWRIFLGDRREYATVLRSGEDPPFSVTEKAGDQITLPIDTFATVNDMDDCVTPRDL